ncbi:MAG: bacteriocin-protection protein [Bacteroidota bacterium]|nr:bacteriocin-protection protein [Bacteroidota bacterium]
MSLSPTFFANQSLFRKWLQKNHAKESELLVGFYKKDSGKPSITWPESVDQALCFGWIDGVRRSLGDESYCIRFTPRKAKSIWSAINIKKMEELIKQGLMKPAGLAAFEKRQEHKSRIYSYENEAAVLDPALEKKFKANKKAWEFFKNQAPSYQKTVIHSIMNAKQETTKLKRFENLVKDSEAGTKIKALNYNKRQIER